LKKGLAMPLSGTGAIIIWNDIAHEGRDEFYDWHLNEHIPERVSVPGFHSGSRYIALSSETTPEFLTLYVTRDETIATSAPYLDRLNAPTPWTKRATAHFRTTSRALTRVVFSQGTGTGGIVGTLRIDGSDAGRAIAARFEQQPHTLDRISRMPRISGVHACLSDLAASAAKTAESRERTDILAAPCGAVLIEGCDPTAVGDAIRELKDVFDFASASVQAGIYRLEHARTIVQR
jgi:hypothetical protein